MILKKVNKILTKLSKLEERKTSFKFELLTATGIRKSFLRFAIYWITLEQRHVASKMPKEKINL